MKCSICDSESVVRSHRKGFEKILKYISPRSPYRCRDCYNRFWVFDSPSTRLSPKVVGIAVILSAFLLFVWYFFSLGPGPRQNDSTSSAKSGDTRKPGSGSIKTAKKEVPQAPSKQTEPTSDKPAVLSADTGSATQTGTDSSSSTSPAKPVSEPEKVPPPLVVGAEVPEDGTSKTKEIASVSKRSEIPVPVKSDAPEPKIPMEPPTDSAKAAKSELSESLAKSPDSAAQSPQADNKAEVVPPPKAEFGQADSGREFRGIITRSTDKEFAVDVLADGPLQENQFTIARETRRLAVNFPGKWFHEGDAVFKVNDSLARQIRLEEYPDHLRLVVDMRSAVSGIPVFKMSEQGMRIIFSKKEEIPASVKTEPKPQRKTCKTCKTKQT